MLLTTSTRGSGWRPLDRTDLGWSGSDYTYVATGLALPDRDRVLDAVARHVEQDPLLYSEVDLARGRYRPTVDRSPRERAAQVVGDDLDPGLSTQEVLDLMEEEPLGHDRLRLHLSPGRVALRFSHGAGDAWSCLQALVHLQRLALDEGPVPLSYDVLAPRRRDAVLVREALRRPGAVLHALRHRRELGGGEYVPSSAHPGTAQASTISMTSDHGLVARLKQQREHFPDRVSVPAVVAIGVRRHLTDLVGPPEPGAEVLFGTRTGSASAAFGNWAAGVYVRPRTAAGDPADDDPVATTRTIAGVRDRGLPWLAALSSRRRAGDVASGDAWVLAPTGRPRLCLSHLNQGGPQRLLRGIDGAPVLLASGGRPNGLETLLVATRETQGALDVSLSFHPAAYPRPLAEELVRRVLADPWGGFDLPTPRP